jgi:hypothetical protein
MRGVTAATESTIAGTGLAGGATATANLSIYPSSVVVHGTVPPVGALATKDVAIVTLFICASTGTAHVNNDVGPVATVVTFDGAVTASITCTA